MSSIRASSGQTGTGNGVNQSVTAGIVALLDQAAKYVIDRKFKGIRFIQGHHGTVALFHAYVIGGRGAVFQCQTFIAITPMNSILRLESNSAYNP